MGTVTFEAELWFDALESYFISAREQGSAAANFLNMGFDENGAITHRNVDGTLDRGSGPYTAGRIHSVKIIFDLDAGNYDAYLDGVLYPNDLGFDASGRGIGSVLFGTTHDSDLDGRLFMDNIKVTATDAPAMDTTVTWSIDGDNGTMGTIDSNGLYTAPSVVPANNPVTIRATSNADTGVSGTALVTVVTELVPTSTPSVTPLGPTPTSTPLIVSTPTPTGPTPTPGFQRTNESPLQRQLVRGGDA